MSGALAMLAANPWLAIGALLGCFLLLLGGLQLYVRIAGGSPEITRKLFHLGSGILTLTFPFLFRELWPVLLLTGVSTLTIAAITFLPPLRRRFGAVTSRVERTTLGELYFPIAIALLFWLSRGQDPLLFVIPVLMLTFGDATSALVGKRYGMTPYEGASKSLEGSIAFLVVAFLCVHVPLLLWSSLGRAESLLIAATLALLVMLLEGSAWRGLDNLFIPIGGYFLLRAYMPMDATALTGRLLITLVLVGLIAVTRRRTTLEDDSLVAGAFLCYVAWAVMGWQWLVAPLAILLAYRWLSAATRDNSRRMHGMPALLSVWAAAVAWISLANAGNSPAMLFPYTIGFGAHLAMFGTSRLAAQFPDTRISSLFARAVVTAWAVVMLPWLIADGSARPPVFAAALAVAGLGAIGVGTMLFVRTQPDIRAASQRPQRWLVQAGAAGIASAAAWVALLVIAHGAAK